LNPEIPYKTLLLLPTDKTETVIRDALDKYGLGHEKVADYRIVKVIRSSECEVVMKSVWLALLYSTRNGYR